MIYYKAASPFAHGWQWVSETKTSLNAMYAWCNFNRFAYPEGVVFGTSTGDALMLNQHLQEHILGHPAVCVSIKKFLAEQKFDVLAHESNLNSWVLKECETYLHNIQANPFYDRDQLRIQRRLEFIKFLVVSGRMNDDFGFTVYSDKKEKIPQEIRTVTDL